ncbi:DUF2089 domain-containing protein [Capsulimonas corticalis]|uniref:DUF2089 domain-containing protein n=1 Tax=Capsulimonas corticalis TaxID=2219043 RepID=UPI0014020D36|nr:DUF2089 domain-containing protein [Capsulimonas corticalis]
MSLTINACPVCQGEVEITEVSCVNCDVQVRGHFTPSRYDRLSQDQTHFLETFLRCRGVIKDVEAALGISYPTVKGRLDALVNALRLDDGASAPPAAETKDPATRRKEILQAVNSGELDADAALLALKDIS